MPIKMKMDSEALLTNLGLDAVVELVKLNQLSVVIGGNSLELKATNSHVDAASVPVTYAVAKKIIEGSGSDAQKEVLRTLIVSAVYTLGQDTGNDWSHVVSPTYADYVESDIVTAKPVIEIPGDAFHESGHMETQVFDLDQLDTADKVDLLDAKLLYQPVKSTDSSSRYFLVAIGVGFKVAARYKNSKLSLRIEGSAIKDWKKVFAQAGTFGCGGGNCTNKYASMHVAVSDAAQASRVLGAVLFSIPAVINTPIPQIKNIVGKGS